MTAKTTPAKAPSEALLLEIDTKHFHSIETLETQLAGMALRMTQPDYYQRHAALVTADNTAMAAAQAELDTAYLRWEQLEGS